MANDQDPLLDNGMGGGQQEQQQQQQPENGQGAQQEDPPRVRRTHVNDNAVRFLASLPLYNKLEMNKNIEQANISRLAKTAAHLIDPDRNPEAGSDTASMITIDEIELADCSMPTFGTGSRISSLFP